MANKLGLNLLIDKQSRRVVFAEAGKDFIDFLFSLLTLPLGAITKLLTEKHIRMVGSIGSLHESVQNLGDSYIRPKKDKDDLLNPRISLPIIAPDPPFLQKYPYSIPTKKYYTCSSCSHPMSVYVTDINGLLCPNCNKNMSVEIKYIGLAAARSDHVPSGRFVKGEMTFMVMDDLMVTPTISPVSTLAHLKKYNVRDITALEEKVVEVGMDEGLALLKASLHSKTVLTDVFLLKRVKEETKI